MLFHATPGSGLMVSEASAVADELAVSLVCVNRPGYGGSAMAAPGFAVAVQDALAVADVLEMERFGASRRRETAPWMIRAWPGG